MLDLENPPFDLRKLECGREICGFLCMCYFLICVGLKLGWATPKAFQCVKIFSITNLLIVCVSFSSFSLILKSKPMETLWLQIKRYVISLIAHFKSCFVESSIFHVRFPWLLGITLNPKIYYSWSNLLNLYSLKFKIKHVCFLLELHYLFT